MKIRVKKLSADAVIPSKEIKELIIHRVDKRAEHEIYPKDIFNEIYEYINKWYKDEN